MEAALQSSAEILRAAVAEVKPDYVVSMVSGGRDSACSHAVTVEAGIKVDLILHGNTRTGIPETSQFVTDHYGQLGPDFAIADAGTAYQDYVLRKGFFGKGRNAHNFSYRVLKATPFRKAISALIRQRKRGVKVLLINGARKDESANRTATLKVTRADPAAPGNIWVNAIHEWTQEDRDAYLTSRSIPKALCRSSAPGRCRRAPSGSKPQPSTRIGGSGLTAWKPRSAPSTALAGASPSPTAPTRNRSRCSNPCASAATGARRRHEHVPLRAMRQPARQR
jgi:3'-phosphoadenosine 5'-phosphosulfate sulfotransferase (PAPS reductase)/FAD synthetase